MPSTASTNPSPMPEPCRISCISSSATRGPQRVAGGVGDDLGGPPPAQVLGSVHDVHLPAGHRPQFTLDVTTDHRQPTHTVAARQPAGQPRHRPASTVGSGQLLRRDRTRQRMLKTIRII